MKPSDQHALDAELMLEFRNAYVDLVNASRPTEGRFFLPELGPAVEPQSWSEKRTRVATAAGAAADAYHRYGGTFTLRNAAYISNDVDPVANWEMSIRDPEQLPPATIVASVESAIGRARQAAAVARARERGLTGLIAAFLRWPSNLRDAVGPAHPAQRTAAGLIGVVGQILVTGLGGAVTVGVVAGLVALWRTVF